MTAKFLSELPPSEQVFRLDYWQIPVPATEYQKPQHSPKRAKQHLGIGKEMYEDAVEACVNTLEGVQTVGWETRRGTQVAPINKPSYFNQPGTVLVLDMEELHPFDERRRPYGAHYASQDVRRYVESEANNASRDTYLGEPQADDAVTTPPLVLAQEGYRETPPRILQALGAATIKTVHVISENHARYYKRKVQLAVVGLDRKNTPRLYGGFIRKHDRRFNRLINRPTKPLILGETISHTEPGEETHSLIRLRALGICYTPATAPASNKRTFSLGRFAFGSPR